VCVCVSVSQCGAPVFGTAATDLWEVNGYYFSTGSVRHTHTHTHTVCYLPTGRQTALELRDRARQQEENKADRKHIMPPTA